MNMEKKASRVPQTATEAVKKTRKYLPGAVAAGALVLAGCGPASARQNPNKAVVSKPAVKAGHPHKSAEAKPPSSKYVPVYNNPIWSGYVAQSKHNFKAVEGKVVVPKLNCKVPGSAAAFWVGYTYGNTVEQTGVTASCDRATPGKGSTKEKAIMPSGKKPFKSTPSYYAWWMMFGAGSAGVEKLNIHAGDTVDYKVAYGGLGKYTMSVRDLSNGKHFSTTQHCEPSLTNGPDGQPTRTVCDPKTVEWVVERPGNSPLANFGTAKMFDNTAKSADGKTHPMSYFELGRDPSATNFFGLNMQHGKQLDRISYPAANGDFNVTWLAAGKTGP